MAQIKKMMIQGIRSFDPDTNNAQTIEFYSPLTLIVGQNGCGKTTIIEALKFAITSEYPPGTSKGGSFVHDPKLSTGYEVPAMVRLELKDKNGDRVIMTRRIKATQKGTKGNVSTSSVEVSLRRMDHVTKAVKDMSGKCADVKDEMSRLMGVSEAILNHVILCHQEDSCWPLDEGKKVKERFDAIFNTTMYMKALDRLVAKDKLIASDIKVWEANFQHGMVILREMTDKQNQVETLNAELQSLTASIEKNKKDAEELEGKVKALQDLEKNYAEITAKLEYQNKTIKEDEEYITGQTKLIGKVKEGTIQELKRAIANFEEGKKEIERKLRTLEGQDETKAKELDSLRKQNELVNTEKGMLAQARIENDEAKNKVKTLTNKVASIMRVMKDKDNSQDTTFSTSANDFLGAFEDGEMGGEHLRPELVVKAIFSGIKSKQIEERKLESEFEAQEKDLQRKVDKLRESIASTETEIGMKRKEIDSNSKALNELRSKLSSLEGSGEALEGFENDIEHNDSVIQQITSSNVISKNEVEIQKLQKELKQLQQQREKVKRELELLRADKIIADKIHILSNQKKDKQNGSKEILTRSGDQLREVLGQIPDKELSVALDTKVKALTTEITGKEREQRSKMQQLSSRESEMKHVQQDLEKKKRHLEDRRDKAVELLEGDSFDEVYDESTRELSAAQKQNYFNDAAQFLYEKYAKKVISKSCCPLCKRDFEAKKDADALARNIQDDIQKLKRDKPGEQLKVERLEQKTKALSEFKPVWEEMKALEDDEIPALQQRKSSLESIVETLQTENQALTDSIDVLKDELSMANNLKRDATLYDQLVKDVQKLELEIKRCERERNADAKDCTMTLSDAEAEMEAIERNISTKQSEKENKESTKSRKEKELARAESARNDAVKQKLELQSALQNRDGFEAEKKKLEKVNKELLVAIEELQKKLPPAKGEINKLQNSKEELKRDHDVKISASRKETAELDKYRDAMVTLKKQLEKYEDQKRSFETKQKQFAEFSTKLTECEDSLKDIKKEIEDLRTELATSQTNLQGLSISVLIKEKQAKLEADRREKKACEEAVAASRSRGVGPEKRQLLEKLQSVNGRVNRSYGQKEEKQSILAQVKAELVAKDKPYYNAEIQLKEALIRKTVFEKVRKDMRIYRTALEHAVLTFHHKKMETINKYLKCFWKKVYRGNDVDYIQIKTDNEDAAKSDTVKIDFTKNKRRTYNYRVVMIRRGIEQDMRGHCSAGQKILASILIRLALAQTFSCKCGLITLDEPTTNLDKANIDSLAETLSDLALDMRDMKAYQLVVITHDQDFVDKLLRVDPVDYYFKVSRNQNGHSKIERVSKLSS